MASFMPDIAHFVTQTPGLCAVVKALGGIAQERRMPPFARQTFTQWFRTRPKRKGQAAPSLRVMLWPDTFNNFFLPTTAMAAVHVLEAAGCEVIVPDQSLCCGRPLYDFGMLTLAKSMLRQILDTLATEIAAGTPMVGLEPSCVAVFRDELINLFPHDEQAMRLARQTFTLPEFLLQQTPEYRLPTLAGQALVHGHCHHKAIMKLDNEVQVLEQLGLDYDVLDSGCCGMAGSFGFQSQHYDTSLKVGELVLLPAIRKASKETLIIADGFSCREQIAQATDRQGLHVAEVLHLALQHDACIPWTSKFGNGRAVAYPERLYRRHNTPEPTHHPVQTAALIGGAAVLVALAWKLVVRPRIRGVRSKNSPAG
jgi:Fe-S oxidoreductase